MKLWFSLTSCFLNKFNSFWKAGWLLRSRDFKSIFQLKMKYSYSAEVKKINSHCSLGFFLVGVFCSLVGWGFSVLKIKS